MPPLGLLPHSATAKSRRVISGRESVAQSAEKIIVDVGGILLFENGVMNNVIRDLRPAQRRRKCELVRAKLW